MQKAVDDCIEGGIKALEKAGWTRSSVRVVGITNQRETTVVWSRKTGKPLSRAIVWDDVRIRGLVNQYEKKLADQGIEVNGKIEKGPKALRKLWVPMITLSRKLSLESS